MSFVSYIKLFPLILKYISVRLIRYWTNKMLLTELQTYSLSHLANLPFSSSSSGDNSYSFITEKGIDILELAPDPRSVSPSLTCRRYVIIHPKELPTANLGINPTDLLPFLDKDPAYALILDIIASPRLHRTLPPNPVPRLATWSPVGILFNQRCILAVLTDVGYLSLYVLSHAEYIQKSDISTLWLEHCKKEWRSPETDSESRMKELVRRAEVIKFTAITWLDQVVDGKGYLAAVSKSGMVSMWEVTVKCSTKLDLDVRIIHQFDSGLKIPTMLYWTRVSEKRCLLTVAGVNGIVRCFTLSAQPPFTDSSPALDTFHDVWLEEDRIATTFITSWPWKEGLLLWVVKGAFVIAIFLSKEVKKLSFAAYRCCDTSVNGLTQLSLDEVMVVTRSSRFTCLSLTLTDEQKVILNTQNVDSYINIHHMGCYGLHTTLNNVICFVLLSVNQSYDHLRLREPTQVVVCNLSGHVEPQVVLQDANKPISQLWDCLELLRVQILQRVIVSELKFPREVLDSMSIDQLTSTLWWITFAARVEENEDRYQELINLQHETETLVISCHFFKRIAVLLGSPNSLSAFQLQSLGVLHKWLIQLLNLPQEFSTSLITGKTLLQQLETLKDKIPYKEWCTICGDVVPDLKEVFYSVCVNGDRMPRCSLTLVQCDQMPFFVCSQCGALAHPLAVEECGTKCNLCGGVLRIDEEILQI